MIKRLHAARSLGVIIDVQEYFLANLEPGKRRKIESRTGHLARLLAYLRIPTLFTIERPVAKKGGVPAGIAAAALALEKDFFDLTKEPEISAYLQASEKNQFILAGCETDVCVLQSCLGLLGRGQEVFVVEDLLFSGTPNVNSAIERMKNAGAVFLTYKTLFHELLEAMETSEHRVALTRKFGQFPPGLPDE